MAAMPPQPPGGAPPPPPDGPPDGYPPAPPQYPGAYPSRMPQPAYPGQYGTAPYPGRVRRRTGWMTFAQVVVIVEASLGIIVSLGLIAAGAYFLSGRGNLANTNIPGYGYLTINDVHAAAGVLLGVGVVALVISILVLVLGITLGRPSNVSRWIIVVLITLGVLGDLAALAQGRSGRGAVAVIVPLVIQALVFYALVLDPNTRRAFAGLP
ncbi:MAG: hypothetical protein E6I33_04440 [Chloroflexi bacterium]|nr:MAG: hypothetical protein E6I33_04440 [Chloroflexota bacterium]